MSATGKDKQVIMQLMIRKLNLGLTIPKKFRIDWIRGPKRAETPQIEFTPSSPTGSGQTQLSIKEEFEIVTQLLWDVRGNKYESKASDLELIEVGQYGQPDISVGRATFDIAPYGPILDSEPDKKLVQELNLTLIGCPFDPTATISVSLTFINPNKKAEASTMRETMINGMLGKFMSASQAAKQELKLQAESQIRELKMKIAQANLDFQKAVAPTNKALRDLDDQRLHLEEEIQLFQGFLKKHNGVTASVVGLGVSQQSHLEISLTERETREVKEQIFQTEKDISRVQAENKRITSLLSGQPLTVEQISQDKEELQKLQKELEVLKAQRLKHFEIKSFDFCEFQTF